MALQLYKRQCLFSAFGGNLLRKLKNWNSSLAISRAHYGGMFNTSALICNV